MRFSHLMTGLLLGFITSPLLAQDPNPLGLKFEEAKTTFGKICEKQELKTIGLLLREDRRSLENAKAGKALKTIQTHLENMLTDAKVTEVNLKNTEALPDSYLKIEDLAILGEDPQFDAVLTCELLQLKSATSIRLALLTREEQLWAKRIRFPRNSDLSTPPPSKKKKMPQIAATNNGGIGGAGNSGPRPGQPMTYGGASGFQYLRSGAASGDSDTGGTQAGGTETGVGGTTEITNSSQAASDLNKKVLQFAEANLGNRVGNGQCWTLAADALIFADAQPANGYTFGKEIPLSEITPGDILQFKRAKFEAGGYYTLMGIPDHTAIVKAASGKVVSMLHQNFGQKIVTELTLNFETMTSGQVWAFRPQPK